MKKIVILILIFAIQKTFSQKANMKICKTPKTQSEAINTDENKTYIPMELDIKPEFPGGIVKFNQFIDDKYKKSNKKPTHQGKLFATFIIEKDGSLSDIKVLRDIGFGSGEELIRVLKSSPRWKAGKQNNKEIRTLYSLVFPVQI